jgi:hypothetical protein
LRARDPGFHKQAASSGRRLELEQYQALLQPAMGGLPHQAHERSDADAPAKNAAGRARWLCKVSEPDGPSIAMLAPIGSAPSVRLDALSRIQAAMNDFILQGAH